MSGQCKALELEIHSRDEIIENLKKELDRVRLDAARNLDELREEQRAVQAASEKAIVEACEAKTRKVVAEAKKRQWVGVLGSPYKRVGVL